jgi:hypothetical protein
MSSFGSDMVVTATAFDASVRFSGNCKNLLVFHTVLIWRDVHYFRQYRVKQKWILEVWGARRNRWQSGFINALELDYGGTQQQLFHSESKNGMTEGLDSKKKDCCWARKRNCRLGLTKKDFSFVSVPYTHPSLCARQPWTFRRTGKRCEEWSSVLDKDQANELELIN